MQDDMASILVKDETKTKYFILNMANNGNFFLVNENAETLIFPPEKLYNLFYYAFKTGFELEPKPERRVCEHSGIEFDVK